MPIQDYGVLSGSVTATLDSVAAAKIDPNGKPHYHVEISAAGHFYRAAVNVLSDDNPPDLQFYLDDNYSNAILQTIKGFAPGFLALPSRAGTGALDYIRENLVDISKMAIVPPTGEAAEAAVPPPGSRNLDDVMNQFFGLAQDQDGVVYFFGSGFSDKGKDEYFGFSPSAGIHNIHMNQDSTGSFADENGPYQDGAVFIYYPSQDTWTAMFTKFQSQVVS
jgi:uncharacterized protein YukJ